MGLPSSDTKRDLLHALDVRIAVALARGQPDRAQRLIKLRATIAETYVPDTAAVH